ncbi:hypothetical protein HMSSN036_63920 [Paenibacillus macerans]|nr:hypothetical protein HMSSN036_63920 [Paenibacillus macerans]
MLLTVYRFLKRLYGTVDQYQEEVYYIMNGGRTTWIDDTEEGSLSRLAAAINTMISSLQTHIAKEKQNRLFLKETMTNISHQLKTPLSALFMYNEIMQGEAVNNETVSRFWRKAGRNWSGCSGSSRICLKWPGWMPESSSCIKGRSC